MRTLTSHQASPLNNELTIAVLDERGQGNANHRYDITGFDTDKNPSATNPDGYKSSFGRAIILFQNGPIKENGVNGISNEALLAIVQDRLEGFQSGQYACKDNEEALVAIRSALWSLSARTRERLARGVEGTNVK